MEDVNDWEHELHGRIHVLDTPCKLFLRSPFPGPENHPDAPETEPTPEELEQEELDTYAEEFAVLADFEDLGALGDEIFSLSDLEDDASSSAQPKGEDKIIHTADDDVDMAG